MWEGMSQSHPAKFRSIADLLVFLRFFLTCYESNDLLSFSSRNKQSVVDLMNSSFRIKEMGNFSSLSKQKIMGFILPAILGGVLLLIAVILSASFFYGSSDLALAVLRGDEVIVSVTRTSEKDYSVLVRSAASTEVKILGITPDCTCIEFEGLPSIIPPHGQCQYDATLKSGTRMTAERVVVYTTSKVSPFIVTEFPN